MFPFTSVSSNQQMALTEKEAKSMKDFEFEPTDLAKEEVTKPEVKKFTVKQ